MMTEKITGMSSLPKEAKKAISRSETERSAVPRDRAGTLGAIQWRTVSGTGGPSIDIFPVKGPQRTVHLADGVTW